MMALSERQKKHLRRLGHDLHPVVLVGQRGLNPGVVAELKLALDHHELVKLRARAGGREARGAGSITGHQKSAAVAAKSRCST